jgi:nucleotide-binding universal stress UspA family protein
LKKKSATFFPRASMLKFESQEDPSAMKTIFVPVDFSDVTQQVLSVASSLAAAFQCRLVVIHVAEPEPDFVGFEPGPPSVRVNVARDLKAERQRLETMKDRLVAEGRDTIALTIQGPAVETILREARDQGAGLIVMGSHGHGSLYELLIGSVTHGVMKNAHCPVVVVPAKAGKGK